MGLWTFASLEKEWCHPLHETKEEAAQEAFKRVGSPAYVGEVKGCSIDSVQLVSQTIKS